MFPKFGESRFDFLETQKCRISTLVRKLHESKSYCFQKLGWMFGCKIILRLKTASGKENPSDQSGLEISESRDMFFKGKNLEIFYKGSQGIQLCRV